MHFTQQTLAEGQATKCEDLVSLDCIWSRVTCLSEVLILDFFFSKKMKFSYSITETGEFVLLVFL